MPFSANAADTFYRGAVVFVDTAGGVQVTAAAGDRCKGVVLKQQVIAAVGDQVEVMIRGIVAFPAKAAVVAADEGSNMLLDASATLTDNIADACFDSNEALTEAANDTVLGRIERVTSSQMFIHLGSQTGGLFDATTTAGMWI